MFDLYLLTFNCARHLVDPDALAPSLFDALPPSASLPDVVAISLQEISPIAYSFLGGSFLTPYFDRVTDTVSLAASLRSHGNEKFEHVATRSLGMTALMIFAKPQFAERIKWIQSAGAGVGLWNMGNKGAVAMRLGVASQDDEILKMTFVAAHLAPMESNIEARNRDWELLSRNLVFLNKDTSGYSSSEEQPLLSSSPTLPEDGNGLFTPGNHIFFAGDLNYRTHDQPPGPKAYETYPQIAHANSFTDSFARLLEGDQLKREKDANRTLHGFEELPITFPPTYKLSMRQSKSGSAHKRSASDPDDHWTWAKHRYPSWCDRILFVPAPPSYRLEPQIYTALPVQATSDHRPVALSVRIEGRPLESHGADDIRRRPPFPINSSWKTRRDIARQLEVIVGVLSYLTLTKKGNAMIVTIAGIAFASWWIAARFSR